MTGDSQKDDRWPPYHDMPKYSTFVLGVIGTQYARLEWAFAAVFATTIEVSSEFTSSLLPKIGNDIQVALIQEAVPGKRLGPEIEGCIEHFLTAYKSLAFNRNMLIHSQIMFGGATTTILMKTQRDGKTVGCQLTIPELRQIADDMEVYRVFGMGLANHISFSRHGVLLSTDAAPVGGLFPLPDKPPQPGRLEYTSDPILFR
jgi:hypothetical protein